LYASSVPDLSGQEQALGQWSQDWLLLNFWATWCAPCREEMPYLAKLPQKYAGRHLKLLGIAADNAAKAAKFAQEAKIDYTLLAGEGRAMELAKRLGNEAGALPYTVLIAPGGRIAWVRMGALDARETETILDKMLPK
jgi:thiol-disulfide isomerase/thioredoxin